MHVFNPKNNGKLVEGFGFVKALYNPSGKESKPLTDPLFEESFNDAINLVRRVEVLKQYRETKDKDKNGDLKSMMQPNSEETDNSNSEDDETSSIEGLSDFSEEAIRSL